ncbi:uncharacterized protein LOC119292190 [Triticum dicoccoides]|uniref:uncharacterized protein LOC119292190 n=2 Tax=Triticum dicoccoides TaxID=85692 RepID=UPI00188E6BE7|nr:uncharacterized protein LOC119292190 [Triticum dicoccoides]
MVKASELVKWSLVFENSDSAALMRIEFLVVAIAAIFLLMSFLDMYRRQCRHSAIKYLLLVLDAISDSSFIYTIGLMQSAPFKKDLFSIWALVLVNLRFNACFISAYGIPDQDNSRITEGARVMSLLGVAFLIGTQNSQFKHPIWVLWAMQQVRSKYLIVAYNKATGSFLHGRSSPLLTAYMGTDAGICKEGNPTTMNEYKYLVSGDQDQKVKLQAPEYKFYLKVESEGDQEQKAPWYKLYLNLSKTIFGLKVESEGRFITLDKTWEQLKNQHSDTDAGGGQRSWAKDLCLSFALYRLLRCRFDDLPLPDESLTSTRKLMYEIIGKKDEDLSTQTDHHTQGAFNGDLPTQTDHHTERAFSGDLPAQTDHHAERAFSADLPAQTDHHAERAFSADLPAQTDHHAERAFSADLPAQTDHHAERAFRGDLPAQIDHAERAFRIAKLELAFLNDYFYTRYPILFWRGFPLIFAWYPLLTIALIAWLGRDIHKLYKPKVGETAHVVHGVNVDLIITWIFMCIIVLKESWKVVTYLLSDWTKVMLLCEYSSRTLKCIPQWLWEFLVRILCTPRCRIVRRWHNKIGQYEFLQSFGHNPRNIFYWLSLGLVPKEIRGAKVGSPTELPEDVRAAVLKSLCSLDLKQNSLKSDLPTDVKQFNFEWTFKLGTWCHSILVWHIATSLCEIELAQRYNTSLTTSELLCAIKTALNCFSSQPYLIKEDRIEGWLRANYIAANSISRYCAYLLVIEPDLLPDSFLTADDLFRNTVDEALDILKGCDTLQSIYRRLIRGVPQQDDQKMDRLRTHPNTILASAARLAWSLIHEIPDEVVRWKVLAEVWADILVHTAPSWNASAHKKCLATGSEFITHIWVILSHCNVHSSKRWPYQEPPQDDDDDDNQASERQEVGAPAPSQEPTVAGDGLLAQEGPARVLSNGALQEQDQTSSPTLGQHLTTNGQQLAQKETEEHNEIQEVRADWKG